MLVSLLNVLYMAGIQAVLMQSRVEGETLNVSVDGNTSIGCEMILVVIVVVRAHIEITLGMSSMD